MHHYKSYFTLFLLFENSLCAHEREYCEISQDHALCIYFEIGRSCWRTMFSEIVPTEKQEEEIGKWHNSRRQAVADRLEGENPQYPAANMMKMHWDPELARIAQITANQCDTSIDCSECRRVIGDRFAVGQNYAFDSESIPIPFNFTKRMQGWFDEVKSMPPNNVNSFVHSERYSNYSQLVWWNTRSVGCGGAVYKSRVNGLFPIKYILFCAYGPAGNIPNAKMYIRGKANAKCPEGTNKDDHYPGLCDITEKNLNVRDEFLTDKIQYKTEDIHIRKIYIRREELSPCLEGTEIDSQDHRFCAISEKYYFKLQDVFQKYEMYIRREIDGCPGGTVIDDRYTFLCVIISKNFFVPKEIPIKNMKPKPISGIMPKNISVTGEIPTDNMEQKPLSGIMSKNISVIDEIPTEEMGQKPLSGIMPKNISVIDKIPTDEIEPKPISGIMPKNMSVIDKIPTDEIEPKPISGIMPKNISVIDKIPTDEIEQKPLSGIMPKNISVIDKIPTDEIEQKPLSGIMPKNISVIDKIPTDEIEQKPLSGIMPKNISVIAKIPTDEIEQKPLSGIMPKNISVIDEIPTDKIGQRPLSGSISIMAKNISVVDETLTDEMGQKPLSVIPKNISVVDEMKTDELEQLLLSVKLPEKISIRHDIPISENRQNPRSEYCKMAQSHVLCSFLPVGDDCPNEFEQLIPTKQQEEEILDWHNSRRQDIAFGLRGKKPQYSASNMMKMQWDPELALIAQSTASQCKITINCSECRRVLGDRFAVGQNIAFDAVNSRISFNFTKLMQNWFDEVDTMPANNVYSFVHGDQYINYSQLVWWNTRSVGCGAAMFKSKEKFFPYKYILYCAYGPVGNIPNTRMYHLGEASDRCPPGTQNDNQYLGLCAIKEENFNVLKEFSTDQIQLMPPPGSSIYG